MGADALSAVKLSLSLLGSGLEASAIPEPFKSAVAYIPDTVLTVIEIAEAVKKNKQDARELAVYIGQLTDAIVRPLQNKGPEHISNDMKDQLDVFRCEIDRVKSDMEKLLSRSSWRRYVGYSDDTLKISGFIARVQSVMSVFQLETSVAVRLQVEHIKKGIEDGEEQRLIDRLGAGDNGSADICLDEKDRTCLEGTRVPVLSRVERWIEKPPPDAKGLFWLTGVAGSGKSTIAATVEGRESAYKRLGARFRFSRDQPDRNKRVFLELSRQLGSWRGGVLRSSIAKAVKNYPDIAHSTLAHQYQVLIHQPLQDLPTSITTVLIVLDALDECEDTYAAKIVQLIGSSQGSFPSAVKVLITSRPERHLQVALADHLANAMLEHHSLDDEESSLVMKDIEVFFKELIPPQARQYVAEWLDWPGSERLRKLVSMSNGLFIWAATALRFIFDPDVDDPEAQLLILLQMSPSDTTLDSLYRTVLDRAFPQTVSDSLRRLVLAVLGTIVVVRTPINVCTLATLVKSDVSNGSSAAQAIHNVVLRLRSVLVVSFPSTSALDPDADPIRTIHPSFLDYITNHTRCGTRFTIDVTEYEEKLATGCLNVMQGLKRDICEIGDPSKMNADVVDLSLRLRNHVSPGLRYACQHWAEHLHRSPPNSRTVYTLLVQFAQHRFLFWLEVMSLLSEMRRTKSMIEQAEDWLKIRSHNHDVDSMLAGTLYDGGRFVTEFLHPISESALHIYHSALPFTPSYTCIRERYGHMAEGAGVKVIRGLPNDWSECLWVGARHLSYVSCIAFSPDGSIVASGSFDFTTRLWDARTGAALSPPMIHGGRVNCLSFSPDGRVLASGSDNHTVRTWETLTGSSTGPPLEGHVGAIECVAFSSDGAVIASGSHDGTIRLWDAKSRETIGQELKGHVSWIRRISFSSDGTKLTSASNDGKLLIWDTVTGSHVQDGRSVERDDTTCSSLSPEGIIATGSYDSRIRLFNFATSGHPSAKDYARFSAYPNLPYGVDGKILHDGSHDSTIRIWDANTPGSTPPFGLPLQGHNRPITCLTFSPDGKTLLSGSADSTIRLWDATLRTYVDSSLPGHTDVVECVAFSPDGMIVGSGSQDGDVRLWEVASGHGVGPPLRGHSDWVTAIAFSPDGQTVAGASSRVILWNITSSLPVGQPFEGNTEPIQCLSFSPDGKLLAAGGQDNTVCLWDVGLGVPLTPLLGHKDWVCCLEFSPDGSVIASASFDGTVRLWDVKTGAAIGQPLTGLTIPDFTNRFHCSNFLVFSPSQNTLTLQMSWGKNIIYDLVEHFNLRLSPSGADAAPRPLYTSSPEGFIRDAEKRVLFWIPASLNENSPGQGLTWASNRIAIRNRIVPILEISAVMRNI